MAKEKYYAVKEGKIKGIFKTWDECKESVNGVTNAVYKSFSTLDEAKAYIEGSDLSSKHIQAAVRLNSIIAYVDGSYDNKIKKYSFGCVIITPKGEIIEKNGCNNNLEALKSRNVAGELQGAMFATKWAYENGFNKIIIRHDYEGISKWFTHKWKANSYCAVKYIEYMGKYKNKLEISFEKVVAHSGDEYNERADRLAKNALKSTTHYPKGVEVSC